MDENSPLKQFESTLTISKLTPKKDEPPSTVTGAIKAIEKDIERWQQRQDEEVDRMKGHLLDVLRMLGTL